MAPDSRRQRLQGRLMASGARGTVLIAGALGPVGRAALKHFEIQDGWGIGALPARAAGSPPPPPPPPLPGRRSDGPGGLPRGAPPPPRGVPRVVYAALFEKPELGK